MVQYYHDMWAKRSEMLAPLSDFVGECGKLKTTNYQEKQGEQETLTLGFNSSNSISQCQNYHS